MPLRPSRRSAVALAAIVLHAIAACSGDADGGVATGGRRAANGALAKLSGAPIVAPVAGGYRAGDVSSAGSIRGTLTAITAAAAPAAPADSSASAPTADRACSGARAADPGSLAGAIVWLSDARTGKPIARERRFVVAHDHCEVEPRITAALAGGTLHVKNGDRTTHRLVFSRVGTGEAEATITQVDDGSLVANDRLLARPGLFEVRCERHPFTRAWIAAFDHPYFTRASDQGAFALDSVPPGTYKVLAWHERHGTAEGSVTVAAAQPAQLNLTFSKP